LDNEENKVKEEQEKEMTPEQPVDMAKSSEPSEGSLGMVALILGIIGVILSFIPCVNFLGILLGIAALICGIIAKNQNQKFAMAGIILGVVAIVIYILILIALWAGLAGLEHIFQEEIQELPDIFEELPDEF